MFIINPGKKEYSRKIVEPGKNTESQKLEAITSWPTTTTMRRVTKSPSYRSLLAGTDKTPQNDSRAVSHRVAPVVTPQIIADRESQQAANRRAMVFSPLLSSRSSSSCHRGSFFPKELSPTTSLDSARSLFSRPLSKKTLPRAKVHSPDASSLSRDARWFSSSLSSFRSPKLPQFRGEKAGCNLGVFQSITHTPTHHLSSVDGVKIRISKYATSVFNQANR